MNEINIMLYHLATKCMLRVVVLLCLRDQACVFFQHVKTVAAILIFYKIIKSLYGDKAVSHQLRNDTVFFSTVFVCKH